MARLHLNLLGKPEITHGEHCLTFPTRKALALLIYLAVAEGMQAREKLASLLWPESDEQLARGNLRTALRDLRRVLGHSPAPASDHLLVERDAIGFNFATDHELDLQSLNDALATADAVALENAVARCRGEFLEGFSVPGAPGFDDWAGYQREQWHLRLDHAFDRLSQLQSEGGERGKAAATLNRWLAANPLQEAAYRRLMRLHLAGGNRAAALQVYKDCRRVLAAELSIEPAAETQALAEQARRMKAEKLSAFIPHPSSIHLPFVGRAAEHRRLVEAWYRAQAGQAQGVIIEGQAGMGKTRLVTEFLAWAAGQGAAALRGKAFESGGRLPYQPIVEAFRAIFDPLAEGQGGRGAGEKGASPLLPRSPAPSLPLSPAWLAELSRLWPEVHDFVPDLPAPVGDSGLARGRLLEAIARLSESLAGQSPLVILIDDVQWADAASLEVLHYLGRRWAEGNLPCLLLLAARTEELATTPALEEWLFTLGRDLPLRRLPLGALTNEDLYHLVSELAGEEVRQGEKETGSQGDKERDNLLVSPSPPLLSVARWLAAETQGQPFYLSETLQALLEQGVIAWRPQVPGRRRLDLDGWPGGPKAQPAGWLPLQDFVAPGVRHLIRSRLARLSTTAQSLLTAAAVLGRTFSFDQLYQVAGVDQAEGLAALDELLAHHLLAENDLQNRFTKARYVFSHDKIASVVYLEASQARRRLWHERVFNLLRDQGGPAAQLAYHAEAAGLVEPLFTYSLAAGEEAMRLLAVRDAISHYERARQTLIGDGRRQQSVAPEQQRRLYEGLGRAYEINNEWDSANAVYREMAALGRRTAAPEIQVAALNRLAGVDIQQKMPGTEQALAWLEEAQAIAESGGDERGLAETELKLAQMRFYSYQREAAESHASRALALARRIEDADLLAHSLNALAYARFGRSPLDDVQPLFEEARALYAACHNRVMEADCLASLAGMCLHHGQLEAAIHFGRQAYTLVQEIENPWGQAHVAFHLGGALLEQGHHSQAQALLDDGLAIARSHHLLLMLMANLAVRGALHRRRQSLAQARADHLEGLEIARSLSPANLAPILAGQLCSDAAVAGDWVEAEQFAQEALPGSDFSWLLAGTTYWHVIEALLRAGQKAEARQATERFGRLTANSLRCQLPYRRCLALLAAAEGDAAQALNHLQAAVALAEEMGLPHDRTAILARLAEIWAGCP